MKKKPAFRSAFFNPRVLISFAVCAIGVLLALLAFGLYPGGKAFARQDQSNGLAQQTGPVRNRSLTQEQVLVTAQTAEIEGGEIDTAARAPLPPRPNAPTATFVVNTTADTQDVTPGDGICADSSGNCSLRAAITEANALAGTDTITLPAGTYTTTLVAANEDLNAGGDFDITSSLTINGAGAATTIIQAATSPNTATERVIQVIGAAVGGTVNINNVTIQNGNATAQTSGGGVSVSVAATVNLTNVVITNNQVKLANNAFGGGMIVSGIGAVVTLTGCTVSNNSAISTLSTTNGFAGGIYNQQATVNLINSKVTGNISSSFHGGIRTLSSTGGPATTNLTNSTVSNNVAQGLNGAGAPGEGGGVVNIAAGLACTTSITASTISGNSAQIFGAPGAGTAAGGVENFNSTGTTGTAIVNLTNSTVSGNSADIAGGIYSDGSVATMTLKYSTVDSNTATTQGGGLFQDTTAGGLTNLKSSIVANNTAPTAPDISGTITSQNYNHVKNTAGGTFTPLSNDVTGTDPQLSPLQNNGGPTFTYIPLAGSPVVNTIPNGSNECGTTVAVDQRGITRPQALACDKGSVERTGNDATPTPTPSSTPSPTATATATIPPPTPTPTPTPTPVGCQILYDQTDSPSGTGTNSQNFETANDAYDDQAADDFVVPAGNTWTIQQVFAPGLYYNGAGPAASVNVIFYKNTGTLPDSTMVVGTFSNVVPVDPTGLGNFTITLPLGGQLLTAGTYWISVQANLDFTPGGQWAWNDRSVTSNSPSAWQNPGNGFASGCTAWTLKTTCVTGAGPDMNFLLRGCLSVQSPTPTPTPPTVSITGTVTYCTNPAIPPVPGVTMTLTGTSSGSTLTDGSGNYTFSSLASGGNYTVTPTKAALAPGSAGINTLDVITIQRQFLGLGTPLTGCKLAAADVNGVGGINTLDVIAVQRFFLGNVTGTANTGKYQFTPTSRTYTGLVTNQTAQNYDTIVFGDVAGSTYVHRPEGPEGLASDDMSMSEVASTVAAVALPEIAVAPSKSNIVTPVTTTKIDAESKLVGFQGDLTFDERVISFQSEPVSNAGLTGGNWNVSGNVLAGTGPIRTLRISAYSNDFTPLSGSGTLFNLNMTRVGKTAQGTQLIWAAPPDQLIFIDADLNTQRAGNAAPGHVTISAKDK